ncbi:MAG: hypothetical protein WBC44_09455 [Planctomycetaceae bacterium]
MTDRETDPVSRLANYGIDQFPGGRKALTSAEISAAIEDLQARIRGHGQAAVRGGTLSGNVGTTMLRIFEANPAV